MILKTPKEWQEETGITILDPDGWRKDKKSFDEPISEDDWNERMKWSTCMIPAKGYRYV